MIYNFKVENFYSIREMQELNFEEPKKFDDSIAETKSGKYINKINCVVGNNASGKTNILKALTFFIWFAEKSFYNLSIDKEIPYKKHKLGLDKSTRFEIIFDNDNKLYKLELELDKNKVLSEKLSIKKERAFSKVYSISRKNGKFETDYNDNKFITPINKKDRDRFETRKNSSFFSFLTGVGYLAEIGLKNILSSFNSNINFQGRNQNPHIINCIECSKRLQDNIKLKKFYLNYINKFDLGITDLSLEKALFKFVLEDTEEEKEEKESELLIFKHGEGKEAFKLTAFDESAGTINSLSLLCDFYEAFETGGIVIIDEIESSMHPSIVRKLIGLFGDNTINTSNAQLVFSTHQSIFLNDRVKRQIFLVEKENLVNTIIFRLDDIKPSVRSDENFFMKYIAGEYGGVPYLRVI